MRKLILKMSITIDGFVAGPDGENDWFFKTGDPEAKKWVADTVGQAGVHIVGSRSYASWAGYWPSSTDILAAAMNEIPKVVFSRSQDPKLAAAIAGAPSSWNQPRVASGALAQEITRLKEESGNYILAQGGATFARSLVATGLIDEYRLVVHPVVIGRGLALFSDLPKPLYLAVVTTTKFASGAMAHVLRPT